jgi:hypothetical protein
MSRLLFSHTMAVTMSLVAATAGTAAHAAGGGWHNGSWYPDGQTAPVPTEMDRSQSRPTPPAPVSDDDRYEQNARAVRYAAPGRDAWLADCRSRVAARDNGVGGAVIGGVVGGVAGNRIAGRGNRTIGTVGGAAIGAVAGAAIDRAEDRGAARDECEAYLDDYYARYAAGGFGPQPGYAGSSQAYVQPGYAQPVYAPGYAPAYGYPVANGCCGGAPVMMVPAQPQCTETVEYIYEDVPVRQRSYRPARHTKIVPDKRVRLVPDKRINVK